MTAGAAWVRVGAWWVAAGRVRRIAVCAAAGLLLVLSGGAAGFFAGGSERLREARQRQGEMAGRLEVARAEYASDCREACRRIAADIDLRKSELEACQAAIADLKEEEDGLKEARDRLLRRLWLDQPTAERAALMRELEALKRDQADLDGGRTPSPQGFLARERARIDADRDYLASAQEVERDLAESLSSESEAEAWCETPAVRDEKGKTVAEVWIVPRIWGAGARAADAWISVHGGFGAKVEKTPDGGRRIVLKSRSRESDFKDVHVVRILCGGFSVAVPFRFRENMVLTRDVQLYCAPSYR